MPAQPQDHKPKKGAPFRFTGKDGKSYTLPNVSKARDKMTGADFEDAVMAGELGMTTYLVKCLRQSGATQASLAALRAMPQAEYFGVLNEWGEHGDGDGASLGE